MLKILFNSIYKLIRIIYQFLFSGVISDNIDFFIIKYFNQYNYDY